ncbi:uncharacterized protein LOC116304067 [Actinia tenebrosa]|uniref:Uncharacterized protein LOC116304067 n=1 Tax=Actinia tenebrosa TaxID=6105 RepID=A0A6P8IRI0_ACTTE|nr:uncharacterized protein LOC116304067 [Actinia tenebrosa]
METKRKIRRSRSLSDILKVCIPNIVEKENKEICKDEEKSVKATDCNGNEQKTVSLGIKELYKKNATSTTNDVAIAASSHVNNDQSKALLTATGPQKKKPSRKSHRRKRRATLADLSCIDILKPIPEMQEEEDEFNALSQTNLLFQRQFCKDSKVDQNDIGQEPRDVDDESGSGQRQSWRDEVRKEMQQWRDDFEKLPYPENTHNDIRPLNGANGESFELRIEPSKEKSDPNRTDLNVEEQDAQDDSDEDNDEDVESMELKEALSNYEIAYNVNEDENTNIFERLQTNYKKNRQRSDSLSSLTTKSSGSERSSSSVSPVDEKLLHEKMQTVEAPKRRRRFSTSDLHLRCLLHALPSISEEGKKNSFSSSGSSDSNESIPATDLMRRRSGSLPNILAFRQAIIIKPRNDTKVDGPKKKIDEEDDSSHKQQIKPEHREVTSLDQPQLTPNATASKTSNRRNSMSVIEDVRQKSLTDPASAQNGDLPDFPLSIEKNVSILENGVTKGSIESKNLVKALGQKMRASIRRRNSIASLKPWTGIVERSLRLSFPLLMDEENEDGTKDKVEEIQKKNTNSEADYKLFFSGHCKNQKKDNVSVVKGENLPDCQLHQDFTTSATGNCLVSGLESQQSRNSAFTQQKKRYGADKEKDLKTVEQIFEVVKNDHKKINESLTGEELEAPAKTSLLSKSANEMLQSRVSTFSRRSSVKEIPVSKPMKVLKSTSSQKGTLPPESPKLENKRKVPVGRALSNPLPKTSPSVNRPSSPLAFYEKNQGMKQESLSSWSVKEKLDKERPAKTSSSTRPSSPSAFYGKNQSIKQKSLSSWSVNETLDKERPAKTASSTRPPSPSAIVTKKKGAKQELPSSKSTNGKADAKTPSNRPPSPSNITRTNQGIKHEVATSNNSRGTLAKASLSRPPSPSALARKNQAIKQDSSSSKSAKGTTPAKETPPKTPLNRPSSPSAVDRKNRSMKQESSSPRNVKRTLDNETTPKTVSSCPPSPSAFTKSNHCTKEGSSSTISGKGINESKSSSKTPSKPSPKATAQASKRPSSPVTRKRNTKSPQVTRKASINSEFTEKKDVTTTVPNTPKDQGAPRRHSLISNMEEIPKDNSDRALEGIAPNVETSKTTNIEENVTSVPKKQVMEMEEKPIIERVSKEVKDRKPEKVKVSIADVSKVTPIENIQERPRERKTYVNVIRRPLSSSLVITVPASSPEKEKEDQRKQDKHFFSSGINQEEVSLTKKKEEKSNALSLDNSTDKSRYQELGKKQMNVDQNLDQGIERELDSFGSLLEEFENSPLQIKSSTNNDNLEQIKAQDNNESRTLNDAIPTEKRFAALSERYNAIMSKFGMLNETPSSERPTVATTSPTTTVVASPVPDNKSSQKLGVSLTVHENTNKARRSVLPLSEDRVSKVVAGSSVTEKNGIKVGMTLEKPEYKVKSCEVSIPESINTISNEEDCSPVLVEKSVGASFPVEPSLPLSENKATSAVVSKDNIRKDEIMLPVNEVNRVNTPVPDAGVRKGEVSTPYFDNIVRNNGDSLQVSEDKLSKRTTTTSDIDLLHSSFDGKQTKTSLDTPFSEENKEKSKSKSSTPILMSELPTFGSYSTPSVPIKVAVAKLSPLSSCQDASYLSIISKVDKEKDQKKENEGAENLKATLMKVEGKSVILQGKVPYIKQNVQSLIRPVEDPLMPTASHDDEETSALATDETFGALSENTKNSYELCRTTVIARLIDRKLGPRRKTSIVPTFAARTSKVFDDSEAGMKGIPFTMRHFNRYRDYIERVTLKSTVRTEALSIHDILHNLDTSLMEMELVSLCRECTKTLRTLDALGSLPSYLSPNTVIVNPSGTIKFRHLSTDVTIDELFLAPEHTKKFSSEKISTKTRARVEISNFSDVTFYGFFVHSVIKESKQ